MKTLIFSLFVFFSFSNLLAQNAGFKVLLTEGNNTFGQNQFITIGSEISENQTISFQGEYLAIIDSEGKAIELTEKGIYEVKNLEGKKNKGWDYLRETDWTRLFYKKKQYQEKRASITCENPPDQANILLPFGGVTIYKDEIIFNWTNISNQKAIKKYKVYVLNFIDKILWQSAIIEQNEIRFEFDKAILEDDTRFSDMKAIVLKVVGVDNDGKEQDYSVLNGKLIQQLEPADRLTIAKEISQLQNPDCPILSQLVLANYFEEKKLWIDARLAYMKLLEMRNLAVFQALYQNFLYRNGLIKRSVF